MHAQSSQQAYKVNQDRFDMNHNVMHYPEMCASSRISTNQDIERPDNTWTSCLTSQESDMCCEYHSESLFNNGKRDIPHTLKSQEYDMHDHSER